MGRGAAAGHAAGVLRRTRRLRWGARGGRGALGSRGPLCVGIRETFCGRSSLRRHAPLPVFLRFVDVFSTFPARTGFLWHRFPSRCRLRSNRPRIVLRGASKRPRLIFAEGEQSRGGSNAIRESRKNVHECRIFCPKGSVALLFAACALLYQARFPRTLSARQLCVPCLFL